MSVDPVHFWERVANVDGDGCWEWTGATTADGYGELRVDGQTVYVHRVAYELKVGPIPAGKMVCHSCDNRRCCRPDHFFAGTHKTNGEDMSRKGRGRGRHSGRTVCVNGHAFTPENTYHRSGGGRSCKACLRARAAAARVQ